MVIFGWILPETRWFLSKIGKWKNWLKRIPDRLIDVFSQFMLLIARFLQRWSRFSHKQKRIGSTSGRSGHITSWVYYVAKIKGTLWVLSYVGPFLDIWLNLNFNHPNDVDLEKFLHQNAYNFFYFYSIFTYFLKFWIHKQYPQPIFEFS
jgi:hypothetical protein